MIQRIQTLYLLILVIFQIAASQFSLFTFGESNKQVELNFMGVYKLDGTVLASEIKQLLISIIVVVVSVIAVLFFKNRPIQTKLSKIILLLLTAEVALTTKFFIQLYKQYEGIFSLGVATFLILGSIIVVLLAIKAINKDENLIKSVDRIR